MTNADAILNIAYSALERRAAQRAAHIAALPLATEASASGITERARARRAALVAEQRRTGAFPAR